MTVRKIAFLCVLILASISACGGPDIVCTPPPCKEDEVYYCPGKCPGGCGTQCATPTPAATPTPTSTFQAICTPPPCKEDEVYYCPGECPGGCGTQCATPTPAATPTAAPAPADTPTPIPSPTTELSTATPTPTPTFQAICTPPPCKEDEVYYCPGECPGGCGTQCATPTPSATSTPAPTNTDTLIPSPTPTETPIPSDTPTPAPPTHTPEPHPTTGLGVTRTDAARLYQILEFAFELTTDEQGQEHHIGTISDNLAIVELIGPEEDITSASVLVEVPKPPTENQSARTVVYLTTLLTVAAEDWEEGTGWLNDNWNNMGESRTTYANLEVVLVIIPENDMTTVEFTISAK